MNTENRVPDDTKRIRKLYINIMEHLLAIYAANINSLWLILKLIWNETFLTI
jgi:hypothetical protein